MSLKPPPKPVINIAIPEMVALAVQMRPGWDARALTQVLEAAIECRPFRMLPGQRWIPVFLACVQALCDPEGTPRDVAAATAWQPPASLPGDGGGGQQEIRLATAELTALAARMRPDWDSDAVSGALLAAASNRNGLATDQHWAATVTECARLLCRPDATPRHLLDKVTGGLAPPGAPLAGDSLAAAAAAARNAMNSPSRREAGAA